MDILALASMKNVAKCDTWCELQNPVNHRVFERKLRPNPSSRGHVCLGAKCGRETDSKQVPRGKDEKDFEKRVKECLKLSGGKRMGAGDSSLLDAERSNPVRQLIRAMDQHRLSPGFCYAHEDVTALIVVCSTRLTACLGICVLRASICWLPIRPILKHGPRSLTWLDCEHACRDPKDGELCLSGAKPEETLVEARRDTDVQIVRLTWVGRGGFLVEPSHGIESSKWAIFGKQNWRCGMNWKPGYGAQLHANLEPTKGGGRLRQQDSGHGSRNPLRSV
ncbi:hypothetical protein YC2023_072127 [Brassica napus]